MARSPLAISPAASSRKRRLAAAGCVKRRSDIGLSSNDGPGVGRLHDRKRSKCPPPRPCFPGAMISLNKVSKQYGKQLIFVEASFQLNPGERAGLVGPNGAGKTTLFRMIVGDEEPEEGDVSVPKKVTIGYFRQDIEEMSGRSVLDEAIAGSGRLGDLHHELEALQTAMSDPSRMDEMDSILARFGEVQEEYSHLGGYELEARAREVLI